MQCLPTAIWQERGHVPVPQPPSTYTNIHTAAVAKPGIYKIIRLLLLCVEKEEESLFLRHLKGKAQTVNEEGPF